MSTPSEFFRVTSVDMNGYCGREHHPDREDVGLIVRVVGMSVMVYQQVEQLGVPEPVIEDFCKQRSVEPKMLPHLFKNSDNLETLYTCVAPDGRILDLMDFEVEPLDTPFALYTLGKAGDPRD